MQGAELERLVGLLMREHGCHTAVLYGSYARGDAAPESDVDVLFVRESGKAFRDARVVDGVYVDAFIYPEESLRVVDPSLLRVLGGKVVEQRGGYGDRLLARLRELDERGPEEMPEDERRVVLLWSRKMLERFRGKTDLEAAYRRMQLVMQSLEDYFALRRRWFRGSKEAFNWLRENDPRTYERFQEVSAPGADEAAFEALVDAVYGAPSG